MNPIKTRSGLATLAGFAGLALVFSKFSLAAFIWSMFPRVIDTSSPEGAALSKLFLVLIPLPGLVAPVSLWLGMWAWSDLSRHREKSGRLQAGFALIVGLLGTIVMVAEIYQVAKVFFLG